jgi:hypothetical protein
MPHEPTRVARVKDPFDALGKSITGVDGTFDIAEKKVTGLFPVLDGKVLDVNCLDRSVRRSAFTIFMVDSLSLNKGVGSG